MKERMDARKAMDEIRALLGNRSLEDCERAGDILEAMVSGYAIEDGTAMALCSMIFHGICQLPAFPRMIDAERMLANIWRVAGFYLIDDRRITRNDNTDRLIDGLSAVQPEDRLAGCIARVCRDFMMLPDDVTRMKIFLALQYDCALAIVNGRGEGLSERLMYDHLGRSAFVQRDDDEPGRYHHTADERQALRGTVAEELERALFDAMAQGFGEISGTYAGPREVSRNSEKRTIEHWDRLCARESLERFLDEYDAAHSDQAGRFKYRIPAPGERVMRESPIPDGREAREEYVVPHRIDGIAVKRVEHVPDVKCRVLRFEEGIEEIALQGYRGEIDTLVLPDSLVRVEKGSFQNNPFLREVKMNGAVLGEHAFAHCVNLESVHFGPLLWSVMEGAFEGCLRLKRVDFPEKVFSIGREAFSGCAMETLALPGADHLREDAFKSCASLEVIGFAGEIESVRGDPFNGCDNIKRFDINEGIRSLAFVDGDLIHKTEDTVSAIFTRSGKEEKTVYRRVVHTVSNGTPVRE